MKIFYDKFRDMEKVAPETKEEFKEMFPKLELLEMNTPGDNHYNYVISIPESEYGFSMFIGVGSYGVYEIGDGTTEDPEGCLSEAGLILYMQNSKRSSYGRKDK